MIGGFEYKPETKMNSNIEVLARRKFPPVSVLVRKARLQLFSRTLSVMTPGLKALLQANACTSSGWTHTIRGDLALLSIASPKCESLPDPIEDMAPWEQLASDHKAAWKTLVKQTMSDIERFSFHEKPDEQPGPVCEVVYPECSAVFCSSQALAVHRRQKHGVRDETRSYFHVSICRACQNNYHSRSRLLLHLRYSQRCRDMLPMVAPMLESDAVERLDAANRKLHQQNRKRGLQPFFAECPPRALGDDEPQEAL